MALIWNLLRFVVLVEASLCLGFTVVVLRRYRGRYLEAAKHGTAGRRKVVPGRRGKEIPRRADTDWIGLLPLHVWLVTGFSLMAIGMALGVTASHIGAAPLWYGTPWALIELSLLLAGLLVIASYENRVSGRR